MSRNIITNSRPMVGSRRKSTTNSRPINQENVAYMLGVNDNITTLMNNDDIKNSRVINAKKFFLKNYNYTLQIIGETLGLLRNIYSFSENLKKEKNDIEKEKLVKKLNELKKQAKEKKDKTNKIIINMTKSIQNSMIDYQTFNINVNETELSKIVQYLYKKLTTKINEVIEHSIHTTNTINAIKKSHINQTSIELQNLFMEKLSNNKKILTKQQEDLRMKLNILNASIRILTLDPDSLNTGIEIAFNTFETRKKKELAKKLVKDKDALLAKYIKLINDKLSTNQKAGINSNLSRIYNKYKSEFKDLNARVIEGRKGLSTLKMLTQKNGTLPKGKGTSLNAGFKPEINGTSLNALVEQEIKGISLNEVLNNAPPSTNQKTPTKSLNNWEDVGQSFSPNIKGIYTDSQIPIKPSKSFKNNFSKTQKSISLN